MSNLSFYHLVIYRNIWYNKKQVIYMRVITLKSKNSESFYISQGYINNKGVNTSKIIRKLGTLKELSEKLGTDRDGVIGIMSSFGTN